MKSLNQIIAELETFANVHYQIHTFGHGDPWEIAPNSSEIVYPILWLVPTGATTGVNEVTTNFTVLCMDLVRSGEENETEVLSDTLQIILDVVSYYRQQHDQNYIVEFGSQIQPFTEAHPDMLAGHSITVSIRQPFTYNECAIPFSGAPAPLVPTCADATIQNAANNPTYQASVASGGNLVLPQVKVLDSDGVTQILANYIPNTDGFVATCSTPTCADATVQLNGTTVGTIPSGDSDSFTVNLDGSPSGSWDGTAWQVTSPPCDDATIELNGVEMTTIPSGDTENITVLQSSGATQVGSKQGTHWRIDDSAISINGSPVADVMAEDSLDIDVTQGGSPVGSWNGSAWIVPPCPPVPTVTLTVSDTTPDQTDTVTLTGTSGYTDYYFFYDNGTEAVKIAEFNDGTNTYDWTIGIYGNVDVYVIADGEVSDIVPVSITQTYDSDASAYLTFNSYANDSTVYNTTYGITGAMLWTWLSDYFRAIKAETGLYAKLKVGYLFFGSSAAKAKINLFDPQDTDAAFRATINGGWSFGHFGAITNGTNTYMNTHFNPFVQLAANDGGYGIYKLTHSSGTVTGAEFGCTDSTNFEQLISKATIDRSFYGIGSLKQKDGVQISRIRGFIVMNRENDANSVKFFDRSCLELDEDTTSFTAHPNFNMYIGARNNAGSPLLYLESGQALGMWYAFDGLTDSQRIALRVATDTLMNNIGW